MVLRNYSDIKHLKGRHNLGWGSRLVLNYVVLSLSIHNFYLSCEYIKDVLPSDKTEEQQLRHVGRLLVDLNEDGQIDRKGLQVFFAIFADQRNLSTNGTPVGLKTFVPVFHSLTIEKYHFFSLSSHTVRIFLSSNSL